MSNKIKPLISIVGPTASGKTELAVSLALKFNGEIVSADSMQIYKEFNISTAKPTLEQMNKVKHHLINILSVNEEFSVGKFKILADNCIEKIYSENKIPFLVGGTGLYVDSILKNTSYGSFDKSLKNSTLNIGELDNVTLMEILKKVDPVSAKNIHINDSKRIKRAVEFFYTAGYPISVQVENSHKTPPIYETCKIGLNFKNREILYGRINKRVDNMIEQGLVEEVKNISLINPAKTAASAIGYKELLDFINGNCNLNDSVEKIKQSTRRYAKRQLTWFRRDKEIKWIYCDEFNNFSDISEKACDIINKFLTDLKDKYEKSEN